LEKKKSKNQSWDEFTEALIQRFGGRERSSIFERLAKIKQQGNMEDYIQEFEILVSQAPNITEEQMMGYFLAGLQPKIRLQITRHDPKELTRAMEIALDLEETSNWDKYATNSYRTGQFRYTGGTGVMTRSDNHKGGSRNAGSSVVNDARKENRHNTVGIEGTRSRNSRTLPYPERK